MQMTSPTNALAGKTLTYEVTIKGIKTRTVPELNDEFAKELSTDFNTVDDLRNRIRDNMKAEKDTRRNIRAKISWSKSC